MNEYEKLGAGEEFESPAKRYKVSRTKIQVDDFDQCAIRRTIHRLYSEKKYVTIKNLLTELKKENLFMYTNIQGIFAIGTENGAL